MGCCQKDIDVTCAFYSRALGMEVKTFADGRCSLHFDAAKINLIEISDYS